jgi:hypothetical protein
MKLILTGTLIPAEAILYTLRIVLPKFETLLLRVSTEPVGAVIPMFESSTLAICSSNSLVASVVSVTASVIVL